LNPIDENRNEQHYRLSAGSLDESWNPHRWVNHRGLAEHSWKKRRKYEEREEHEEHFREFENLCFYPPNSKNVNQKVFVAAATLNLKWKNEIGLQPII